jgi:hypothetical protein
MDVPPFPLCVTPAAIDGTELSYIPFHVHHSSPYKNRTELAGTPCCSCALPAPSLPRQHPQIPPLPPSIELGSSSRSPRTAHHSPPHFLYWHRRDTTRPPIQLSSPIRGCSGVSPHIRSLQQRAPLHNAAGHQRPFWNAKNATSESAAASFAFADTHRRLRTVGAPSRPATTG